MNADEKLKRTVDALHEAVRELRNASKTNPEQPIGSIEVKAWLLAVDIHMEHLDLLLHDIQPSLF